MDLEALFKNSPGFNWQKQALAIENILKGIVSMCEATLVSYVSLDGLSWAIVEETDKREQLGGLLAFLYLTRLNAQSSAVSALIGESNIELAARMGTRTLDSLYRECNSLLVRYGKNLFAGEAYGCNLPFGEVEKSRALRDRLPSRLRSFVGKIWNIRAICFNSLAGLERGVVEQHRLGESDV